MHVGHVGAVLAGLENEDADIGVLGQATGDDRTAGAATRVLVVSLPPTAINGIDDPDLPADDVVVRITHLDLEDVCLEFWR